MRDEAPAVDVEEAETVDCLRLSDCTEYMECEVVHTIETGDHVLFVGSVRKRVW